MNRLTKLLNEKYGEPEDPGYAIGAPVPLLEAIMKHFLSDLAKSQGKDLKALEGNFVILKGEQFHPVLANNIRHAAEASRRMAEVAPEIPQVSVFDLCICFSQFHKIPAGPLLDLILECAKQQREHGEPETILNDIKDSVEAGKDHLACLCMRCALLETVRLVLVDGKTVAEAKETVGAAGMAKFGNAFMKSPASEVVTADGNANPLLDTFKKLAGSSLTESSTQQPKSRGEPDDKGIAPDNGFAA